MTFGQHMRLAGAVVAIVGAVTHLMVLSFIGLCVMACGAILQIDNLEARVKSLEPEKEDDNV